MEKHELERNLDQLLTIVKGKLAAAKEQPIEGLGSTLVREVLNVLTTASTLIDKIESLEGSPATDPEAKSKKSSEAKKGGGKKSKMKEEKPNVPDIAIDLDSIEMEV